VSNSLTDQEYWDKSHPHVGLPVSGAMRFFIERFCPPAPGDAFEVGCFPGRFLAIFGEHGFRVNGIDLDPRTGSELPGWFRRQGIAIGEFLVADFTAISATRKYDVVASFGLIEHFTNWKEILLRHTEFVKPGGTLIVTTPNFKGWVQSLLHRTFDRANYARHYIPSMDPEEWAVLVESRGFEIVFAGFFGRFDFSCGSDESLSSKAVQFVVRVANKVLLRPCLRVLPEGKKSYALCCGIVARKRSS